VEQAWRRDGARAYLGITIPKFPNLFCLYGPNTNPKAGGLFFFEEMQVRYALSCIREIIERGKKSISCRQETCDDYNQRMDKELQHLSWMHPSQKSYYVNAFGRVDVNMPWMPGTYFNWTRSVNLDDFVVS
jgi:4-hydroxyacetophenone monooxygenase